MAEKRATRYPIAGTVKYRGTRERRWLEGRLVNVSRTGALFETRSAPLQATGTVEFILAFRSPGLVPTVRIRCGGRIVGCRPRPGARWEVATSIDRYRVLRSTTEDSVVRACEEPIGLSGHAVPQARGRRIRAALERRAGDVET